jgi:hypothetical protein
MTFFREHPAKIVVVALEVLAKRHGFRELDVNAPVSFPQHAPYANELTEVFLLLGPSGDFPQIRFLLGNPVVADGGRNENQVVAKAFLDRLDARKTLVSITNNPASELARRARWFLPIDAGDENLVASKTYVNPLAILWLLARQAAGLWDGGEYDTLQAIADRAEQILTAGREIADRLADTFEPCSPLLFLGHGPHGVTARQAAMMMSEWAKLPALHAGIGAFRHGFIETVRPGFGVVIFAAPGCSWSSALELAGELES